MGLVSKLLDKKQIKAKYGISASQVDRLEFNLKLWPLRWTLSRDINGKPTKVAWPEDLCDEAVIELARRNAPK